MKIFYSPKCLEYSQPGHPESPVRVSAAHNYLKEKGYEFMPEPCTDDDILLAHTPALLNSVEKKTFLTLTRPHSPVFSILRNLLPEALSMRPCIV